MTKATDPAYPVREIKFRGISRTTGQFVYGLPMYGSGGPFVEKISTWGTPDLESGYEEIEVIPETVGQSTGLRDKNIVEIYEGDVVKLTTLMFQGYTPQGDEINENETWVTSIIYEGCGFCYSQYPEMYDGVSIGDMDEEIEVIGNIYQHPELIEQLNREEAK